MKSMQFLIGAVIACALSNPASAKQPAEVEFLNSGKVLSVGLPFSEAVRVDNTRYLSGQIGVQPETIKLVSRGLKAETRQTMLNIKTTLESHGFSMRDLVKCTGMLADLSRWAKFNDIRANS